MISPHPVARSRLHYERELINERAPAARGGARALHVDGESVAALCRSFRVSRATVYRTLDVAA